MDVGYKRGVVALFCHILWRQMSAMLSYPVSAFLYQMTRQNKRREERQQDKDKVEADERDVCMILSLCPTSTVADTQRAAES